MSLPSGIFQGSFKQDMAIFRTKTQWLLLLLFLVFVFTMPLYASNKILTMVTIMGITIISVLGLNILTGYCGQISMGHAGFMAVGGYTAAVLMAKSPCAVYTSPCRPPAWVPVSWGLSSAFLR